MLLLFLFSFWFAWLSPAPTYLPPKSSVFYLYFRNLPLQLPTGSSGGDHWNFSCSQVEHLGQHKSPTRTMAQCTSRRRQRPPDERRSKKSAQRLSRRVLESKLILLERHFLLQSTLKANWYFDSEMKCEMTCEKHVKT